MSNIVIIGSSGHAKVIIDIVEKENKNKIIGLIDSYHNNNVLGYPVIGTEYDLPSLMDKYQIIGGIIAIGDNFVRKTMADKVLNIVPKFIFFNAVHPSSYIATGITIGIGTVIMAGVVINVGCDISNFCILNTRSSLDHESKMDNFSSLAPAVTTGGNVNIGEYSAIGIGSTIIHKKKIGNHTIIGAGSTVIHNIGDLVVAYGTPAKVIRSRIVGEKYL